MDVFKSQYQEENRMLDRMNRYKVSEVEKLAQTVRELEEVVLAGGAAANVVRDYKRRLQRVYFSGDWHYDYHRKDRAEDKQINQCRCSFLKKVIFGLAGFKAAELNGNVTLLRSTNEVRRACEDGICDDHSGSSRAKEGTLGFNDGL
ncbi:microtubule-associated protein 70-2-like protein [Tanacetum coccineum]